MATDWNKIAEDNYRKALQINKAKTAAGTNTMSPSDILAAGNKYGDYTDSYNKAYSDVYKPSSSGGSSSGSSGGTSGGGGGSSAAPRDMAPKPELNLPSLTMSEGASVLNQFNDLRKSDSVLKQQAIVDAHAQGVAGGRIHSAQQAGATERSIEDRLMPLAQAEASLVGSTDIANWQQQTNQYVLSYKAEFEDYLRDKGYAHDREIAMVQANTSLTGAYMDNIGAILRAPDIDFGPEVNQKLVDIFNTGLGNNNTILDMGFTYA